MYMYIYIYSVYFFPLLPIHFLEDPSLAHIFQNYTHAHIYICTHTLINM